MRASRVFCCPCGCGNQGFCEPHVTLLARVRCELESPKLVSVGNGRRERPLAPRCCLPECCEPRGLGERFCVEHRDLDDAE